MQNENPAPLIFLCPIGYWGLACDGEYPSVMDYLIHPESIPSFLFTGGHSSETTSGAWVTLTAEVLIHDYTQALVLCREQTDDSGRPRVGIVLLDAQDTTLKWIDESLPVPEPWLSRMEAANLLPPPRYRQGTQAQHKVLATASAQRILRFIQAQELDVLRYLDCGEDLDEDAIAVPFARIVEYLQWDESTTLAHLTHLEDHNLLVSQFEIGVVTDDDPPQWQETESALAYLSVPFYHAVTPDTQTQTTAFDATLAGQLKRQRGIEQLQQALQFYGVSLGD